MIPRRRTTRWAWLAVLVLAQVTGGGPAYAAATLLDDFEAVEGWSTIASEGARVAIGAEPGRGGTAMRVDFDLDNGGGYVIVRKAFSVSLPENFAFTFELRGEARRNTLEFKLVDASGKNVWWRQLRDFVPPADWQHTAVRKSRLEFAWGPAGGGDLQRVSAVEIAIAAGEGGSGWLALDDLAFEEREVVTRDGVTPEVRAASHVAGREPALLFDGDPATGWHGAAEPAEQWVTVDLVRNWEYGGLVIDWDPEDHATSYDVQTSNDLVQWTTVYANGTGKGGRDYVYMPDAESRYIRLRLWQSSRGQGVGIREISLQPVSFAASPNQFFEAIARDAPVGLYPKYFHGRQTYWTVVGADGDDREALVNEEGMVEVGKGAFSIEPFLHVGGELLTWQAVRATQSLEDGYLPIPAVVWRRGHLTLRVTAFASGPAGASTLWLRYRVENEGGHEEHVRLFLAIRPFQVNPPWQSITMQGGVSPIQDLRADGRVVWVNRETPVVALSAPARFGAVAFAEGPVTDFLATGTVPFRTEVSDPFGFASGALQYDFPLAPRGSGEAVLAVPFHGRDVRSLTAVDPGDVPALVAGEHEVARRTWRRLLGRVDIELPGEARELVRILRSTLAFILINRDGPALQPGSRNYARSWIRDGAITSAALLETGFPNEAREFVRWYAGYQTPEGKIPCCIDRRGPDPVSEHDSTGQFIYAVMEYYRHTRDVGFLADMWPHVRRAVAYLEALRERRMTDEFRAPEREAFFGLLPESISHEGYAAHPVHSYWDDFFALRGLKDAAAMASVVGETEQAQRYAALRDEFRVTLYASIERTLGRHGIDYLPGSVELGDFDPTSTSIAVAPVGEQERLPRAALARTFDRYWGEVRGRSSGDVAWEAYSPYEIRNVETLVRLGQRDRALALLDALVADRRPRGWNAWAEISWRDAAAPRFIGDMPHTWVGAGFIHAVRSLLAYEREEDGALVLGAGIRPEWLAGGEGVAVRRLPTHFGALSYAMQGDGADTVTVRVSGGLTLPPGRIVLVSPLARPLRAVTVNGRPVDTFGPDSVTIGEVPADVVLSYRSEKPAQAAGPPAERPG